VEPLPPRICAIIALYNGEAFIEAALRSVMSQDLAAHEIVVVDDGSTDGGPALARRIAEEDGRVRVIAKANGGQSSARNLGVAGCESDFIAFLDQDDAWYPDHLSVLYAPFADDIHGKIGFTYANLDRVDLHGRMVRHNYLDHLETVHPKRSIEDCLGEDMFVLPGASLTRRKAFDEVGGFDERLIGYEDDDLFLRIFERGYRNIYVNEAVTRWRIHGGSTSYSPKMQRSRMTYAFKLIERYPDDPASGFFYVSNVIVPRFLYVVRAEYMGAIVAGQVEQAAALKQDLLRLIDHLPRGARAKMRLLLRVTQHPRLFNAARAVIRRVPGLKGMIRAM
jgi:glycosyltransferase involved in cell wall biosynthesis